MRLVFGDLRHMERGCPLFPLPSYGRRISLACSLIVLSSSVSYGQRILAGSSAESAPVFPPAIIAALESSEPLRGLPCTTASRQPFLGFDLKFHSGYLVTLPVQELEGSGSDLRVLLRITPGNRPQRPIFFEDRFSVPAIDRNVRGEASVPGEFAVGPGAYHVDLLIHDRMDRFCSASWDLTAALSAKDKDVAPTLREGEVQPSEGNLFLAESTIPKAPADGLMVKVLANFAPRDPASAAIDQTDTEALVSMLRNIQRNPQVTAISLVAFNLNEERVVFRQNNVDRIDFPALGRSLQTMSPGTVRLDQLLHKNGGADFLAGLIHDQAEPGVRPDALIFVGPKAFAEAGFGANDVRQAGALEYPVFYLDYVSNPQINPWKDAIGRMVKLLRGYEFNISGPRDLWRATTEVVSSALSHRRLPQAAAGVELGK